MSDARFLSLAQLVAACPSLESGSLDLFLFLLLAGGVYWTVPAAGSVYPTAPSSFFRATFLAGSVYWTAPSVFFRPTLSGFRLMPC